MMLDDWFDTFRKCVEQQRLPSSKRFTHAQENGHALFQRILCVCAFCGVTHEEKLTNLSLSKIHRVQARLPACAMRKHTNLASSLKSESEFVDAVAKACACTQVRQRAHVHDSRSVCVCCMHFSAVYTRFVRGRKGAKT
jgi:hypothetical protein